DRLEPFIEVAVIPLRPAMLALGFPGSNKKVFEEARTLGLAHEAAHRRHHRLAADVGTIGPEPAAGPLHIAEADAVQAHMGRVGRIGQAWMFESLHRWWHPEIGQGLPPLPVR